MSELVASLLIVTCAAVLVAWSAVRRERALTRSLWASTARAERAEAEARCAAGVARGQALAQAVDALRVGYLAWCQDAVALPPADAPGFMADRLREAVEALGDGGDRS